MSAWDDASRERPVRWDEAEPKFPERAAADPDRACAHEDFHALANIGRSAASDDDPTIVAYHVELQVRCANCGEPFRFMGVPAGWLADRPTCTVDEATLNAPIRPASSDPDFGLGLPGYAVRYVERDEL